jgi:hypothetical protein
MADMSLQGSKYPTVMQMLLSLEDSEDLQPEDTIQGAVKRYLELAEYEGLWCPDVPCGCRLDGLMPCGEVSDECQAGYVLSCDGMCDSGNCAWHIGKREV